MAKPLFIIGFPISADWNAVYATQKSLSEKLDSEYHVITYQAPEITSIKFEVLNAINATDIEIKELITRSEEWLNQLNYTISESENIKKTT